MVIGMRKRWKHTVSETVHIVGPEVTWLIKLIRWKQLSHLSVHGPDLVSFFADATFLYW